MTMCGNHPEAPAVAYCRNCGKPLCELCRIEDRGAVFCAEHAPVAQSAAGFTPPPPPLPNAPSPYTAPRYTGAGSDASPALATLLGFIPGVGAIYNGQYAKGLIHAVIFGLLISIVSSGVGSLEPLVGILIGVWELYMVIEAYHTARKRQEGIPVDEFSSVVNLRGASTGVPLGAVVLIGLGVLLLLNTSGLIPIERILRYWPVALIVLGLYMLYARFEHRPVTTREATNERR